MTLTSTGPSGFHIKPIVSVLAAVVFVAGVYAISQQIFSDSQPSASDPTEAVTVAEAAEPYVGPSGLSEAYANGKLDAGLNPASSEPYVGSSSAPEIVVIEGRGSLYNALIEGKYDVDFLSGASGVQYVLGSDTAAGASSQLVEGFGDGTFAERPAAATAAGNTPTVLGGHLE